jgi:hypothetical protein
MANDWASVYRPKTSFQSGPRPHGQNTPPAWRPGAIPGAPGGAIPGVDNRSKDPVGWQNVYQRRTFQSATPHAQNIPSGYGGPYKSGAPKTKMILNKAIIQAALSGARKVRVGGPLHDAAPSSVKERAR